jgi:hypothetical protein
MSEVEDEGAPAAAPAAPSPAEIHPPAEKDTPNLLVVLGMHRSGTSATARIAATLGFDLGEDLVPPAPDNPKGFFEDSELVAIDDALLAAGAAAWDTLGFRLEAVGEEALASLRARARAWLAARGAGTTPIAAKDPRLPRLLPFWQSLFAENPAIRPAYLLVYRHPESVALSLARRGSMDRTYALLLWQEHLLAALRHTEGARRVLIDYDALLDAPAATLCTVAASLGLPEPAPAALAAFAQDFLDPKLRHARFDTPPGRETPPGVGALAALLEDAARTDPGLDQPGTRAEIAALIAAFDPLRPVLGTLGMMLRTQQAQEAELAQRRAERELAFDEAVRLNAENARLHWENARLANENARLEAERVRLAEENAALRTAPPASPPPLGLNWLRQSLLRRPLFPPPPPLGVALLWVTERYTSLHDPILWPRPEAAQIARVAANHETRRQMDGSRQGGREVDSGEVEGAERAGGGAREREERGGREGPTWASGSAWASSPGRAAGPAWTAPDASGELGRETVRPSAPNFLLVLGMHRGGTSAAARAAAALGFALGADLLPPSPDNPAGYWEDRELVAIDEALLAALGARYDTLGLHIPPTRLPPTSLTPAVISEAAPEAVPEAAPDTPTPEAALAPLRARAQAWLAARGAGTRPFAAKDPRLPRLLPFWRSLLGAWPGLAAGALIVYRHPESVALSLARREGMGRLHALLLWQEHMLAALRHTEGMPRALLDFDALIDDPDAALERAAAALGLPRPERAARLAFRACFVDEKLRHSRFEGPVGAGAPPGVGALAALLAEAAATDPALASPHWAGRFAAAATEWARLGSLVAELARLEAERERLAAWIAGLERRFLFRAARAVHRGLGRLWGRRAAAEPAPEAAAEGIPAPSLGFEPNVGFGPSKGSVPPSRRDQEAGGGAEGEGSRSRISASVSLIR